MVAPTHLARWKGKKTAKQDRTKQRGVSGAPHFNTML